MLNVVFAPLPDPKLGQTQPSELCCYIKTVRHSLCHDKAINFFPRSACKESNPSLLSFAEIRELRWGLL